MKNALFSALGTSEKSSENKSIDKKEGNNKSKSSNKTK